MLENIRAARATLTRITEPDDAKIAAFIEAIGAQGALDALTGQTKDPAEFEAICTMLKTTPQAEISRHAVAYAEVKMNESRDEGFNGTFLIPEDDYWPTSLDDLDVPPIGLWIRGDLSEGFPEHKAIVGITGTRDATAYGEQVAHDLARAVVHNEGCVITGGNYGIDGKANIAALSCRGRRPGIVTIAVLGCGADRAHPAGHTDLFDQVAQNGLVISEIAPGKAATRWRLNARNRIIAALSSIVVLPEAHWRGGALSTAVTAHQLDRVIAAVPGSIYSRESGGPHRLLKEFQAVIITDPHDITEIMEN